MQISKAVFPVAGIGSRFLPATKANPKEMLPIVDKPLIQYAVEEAIRAGMNHMIFITSSSKRAIEDHFDNNFELETVLLKQNKDELYDLVKNIAPKGINFTYVRQHQPLGLGHAIMCAKHVVGHESFAVLLADDLIDESYKPCLSTMVEYFKKLNHSMLAVQEVPRHDVHQYGIVDVMDINKSIMVIDSIVEKPHPENAPSNLAVIGRYIFTPEIFTCLERTSMDKRGEIQLTDAIELLLLKEKVSALKFIGKRYDCGSKLGYLEAMVEFGIKHPDIGKSFSKYIANLNKQVITEKTR